MNEHGIDTIQSLLTELARIGVKLRLVDDENIEVRAPKGGLPSDLRDRIAQHKPNLIAWLGRTENDVPDNMMLPTIIPDDHNLFDPFPPSDLQQSFLIGSREGFEYHVRPHQYTEFDFDELDPTRFEKALNRAARRRRKSLVIARDDMLLETVQAPEPLQVTVCDLQGLAHSEAQASIERVRATMQREELPHDRWPWLTTHISLYGEGRARLHYNNNNLFADAPSGVGLINDALHYYHYPEQPLPEIEVGYRDCVLALANIEESPLGRDSKSYWCDRMADWPSAPDIPLVPGNQHRGRSKLSRRELTFPAELWAALKSKADARGVTLTTTLLGAHAEIIAYWSGSRHFLLNNMMTHRLPLHPQIDEVLGNFASLYPLEVDWRHHEPFYDRVRRLQKQVAADMSHIYWSGAKVLQRLNHIRRTPGHAVCPFAVGSALFVGPQNRPFYSTLETPQTLLDTEFWELRDGRLWVTWDVIEAMFPEGLIDAMLEGYRSLVARLATDETAWELEAFDLLPEAQREQRVRLNHRSDAPESPGLLHDKLARQAILQEDKPALVTSSATLTFDDLNSRSHCLAARLHQRGTHAGDLVAVALPKGWEQITAVLGVLTAGAAYVPIDPAWPADRIRYLLSDTEASAILTDKALGEELAELTKTKILTMDGKDARATPTTAATITREPGDLAYVIYTSGSTGRPKGAMLDHRGPLNTISAINRLCGITSDDVLFGISSLSFDLSVYDIFGTLGAGATLVLPTSAQTDPASWIELVRSNAVSVWNSVPAIMQLFVEEAISSSTQLPSLRTVLLSGDWIPVHLPERIRQVAPNANVISLGGATEASIWSVCFPIDYQDPEWPSIPYGQPLTNQSCYVLDEWGQDTPNWVAGQLYIGGTGLALGYLRDQAKTEEAFVPHPQTGKRLYRTGDLGRYLPSGDIEFLGRSDFQVKIQGFRVEPGEIEQALLECPDVRQAAVVARASGSGKQLAAFVVGDEGRLDQGVLQSLIARKLPNYMRPGHITVVDSLPLTANGKLDRRALDSMRQDHHDEEDRYIGARTPVEEILVDIWEHILATGKIGVQDDFFDLGGQSFAALRVIGLIERRIGRRIPLGVLLEQRTVAGLAEFLDISDGTLSPLVRLREAGTGEPWFFVHPAGGNVVCYRLLAELLDGPFHAFQAPGPANGQQPPEKVEDLASVYVRALLDAQPHGCYQLGGWSSGAVIAMEMARQLEASGHTVDRLVVVDAPAPVAPRQVRDRELLLWFLEDLDIGFDPKGVGTGQPLELAGLPDTELVERALALVREQGVAEVDLDAADLVTTLPVFRGVVLACNSYRAATINADITVIRAQQDAISEFADHPAAEAHDWGWSPLTSGSVDSTVVDGTHHTLLSDRHAVALIADAMSDR